MSSNAYRPNFKVEKIFCVISGLGVTAFSLFMLAWVYYDSQHPIYAKIIATEEACDVSWMRGKISYDQMMPCEKVSEFTKADKNTNFKTVKGKSVTMSFQDLDGTPRVETSFFTSGWLDVASSLEAVPINYYPGTRRPLRSVPRLEDSGFIVLLGVIGVFVAVAGAHGTKLRQQRYENENLESASQKPRNKTFGWFAAIVGLLAVTDKMYATGRDISLSAVSD